MTNVHRWGLILALFALGLAGDDPILWLVVGLACGWLLASKTS